MRVITKFKLVLCIGLLSILSCSSDDTTTPPPSSGNDLKILTLGDSRVQGARPEFESYRYELWKNLVTNEWKFDFIGPLIDEASYPEFMSMSFDKDHAGVGGFTTQDVLENITAALSTGTPDVVLLGIGGNDLLGNASVSNTITNINQIIDLLQSNNSNVTIFLEQIAPGRSNIMTTEVTTTFNEFNSSIANVGTQQTDATSRVIVVNMSTDWTDDYMADDVHYNEAGAKVVADRYYEAISQHIEKQ
ncbi:GDSL-type esterase/lipase family protein [Aquimarina gracilis]|uniref:GDSL-type esterase/lipase family protein n=1 Tax=Aquimarina gracilis TaxID=874422 RepID=A0ABU6A237_9FLAO|nr:GDSL-type esterase/lipase family protein [Aquimarina gracilis]MEB3348235.1 GDSL-type esterase/lipase family protein [Aquimarina gracilis]